VRPGETDNDIPATNLHPGAGGGLGHRRFYGGRFAGRGVHAADLDVAERGRVGLASRPYLMGEAHEPSERPVGNFGEAPGEFPVLRTEEVRIEPGALNIAEADGVDGAAVGRGQGEAQGFEDEGVETAEEGFGLVQFPPPRCAGGVEGGQQIPLLGRLGERDAEGANLLRVDVGHQDLAADVLDLSATPIGVEERGHKLGDCLRLVDPQTDQVRGKDPITVEVEDLALADKFAGAVGAIEKDVALFESIRCDLLRREGIRCGA